MLTVTLADQILNVLADAEMDSPEIAERARGWQLFALTPFGSVYASLDRLVESGVLRCRWDDDDADDEDPYPRRRLYRRAGQAEGAET